MALMIENEKYYIDEDFMIRKSSYCESFEEPLHTHDFLEIIYVYKGESEQVIDDRKYHVSTGDALFVNYGSTHKFTAKRGFKYANIIIKPEYIHKSLCGVENAFALLTISDFCEFSEIVNKEKCHMRFQEEEQNTLESLLNLLQTESAVRNAGGEVIVRSCVDIILTLVFRKMSLNLYDRMYLDDDLLEYIRTNCSEMLTLKRTAAMCFYNPSYFSRAFKEFTGKTFSSYLTDCRIERACDLLQNTDSKIETIIEKCGFSDRTRFFKVFTKKTGVSPLQFRKSKK